MDCNLDLRITGESLWGRETACLAEGQSHLVRLTDFHNSEVFVSIPHKAKVMGGLKFFDAFASEHETHKCNK